MKNIFYFGEKVPEYSVRVLNEREARAAAGILFFFSMFSLLNALLIGNFYPLKIFVIVFVLDFTIRLFVNPKYAPTMILGRLAVFNQKPEYTGAVQKKFAWSIGLALSLFMLVTVVFPLFTTAIVCWVCIICVIFLFFEAAFGICLGCKLYNLFNTDKAKLCPGGVCEVRKKEEIQKILPIQVIIVTLFLLTVLSLIIFGRGLLNSPKSSGQNTSFCATATNGIGAGANSPCALLGGRSSNNPDFTCPGSMIK